MDHHVTGGCGRKYLRAVSFERFESTTCQPGSYCTSSCEVTTLRAKVEELEENYQTMLDAQQHEFARAETAERERDEARADTARLDWLDADHLSRIGLLHVTRFDDGDPPVCWFKPDIESHNTLRDALDAALARGGYDPCSHDPFETCQRCDPTALALARGGEEG